jgi:hypothetical protein
MQSTLRGCPIPLAATLALLLIPRHWWPANPVLVSASPSPLFHFHGNRTMRLILMSLLAALALSLSGCGYNDFQRLDEQTKSAWSEVLNQYQRRADLIPNIVATVKGETNFEQRR